MKYFLLFLLTIFSSEAFSQTKFWVQFTDKNGTPYTTSNPSAFLSTRSIQRRINQNIPVITQDLPVNPSYVSQVDNINNVTIINRSKWFNAVTIFTNDPAAITAIQGLTFVQSVSPVARYIGNNEIEENSIKPINADDLRLAPPDLTTAFNYGSSFNQANMIGAVCMHNLGYDGTGMVIAVLDAGFLNADTLSAFDSLFLQNRILGTWDFVSGNSQVYDDNQHGTMVLSCIGGNWPGQIVGTAPGAQFWLFRTEEASSEYIIEEDNWVVAAEFADSVGADVINTSLGYTTFDDPSQNHSYSDMTGDICRISIAHDIAVSKGMFTVCSAGNSGQSSWFYIGAPADADSALAVGAVDFSGAYVPFSSKGPSFDGQVKPNVAAQGLNATVQAPDGQIVGASGTSFSSPITCGAVACLWQANPTYNVMQLLNIIQMSGSQFNNPDSLLGYGIPDFCAANILLQNGNLNSTDKGNVNVFPNPFSSGISVSYFSPANEEIRIEVMDLEGRILFEQLVNVSVNQKLILDLDKLTSLSGGMYMIRLQNGFGAITKKIIKN
jgi:serine protease AprX